MKTIQIVMDTHNRNILNELLSENKNETNGSILNKAILYFRENDFDPMGCTEYIKKENTSTAKFLITEENYNFLKESLREMYPKLCRKVKLSELVYYILNVFYDMVSL